jgi:hypothetical protein
MKTTDRIPLNSTTQGVAANGAIVTIPESRSVGDEIKRLRDAGMNTAAQRLENSCDDHVADVDVPVDTDALLGITPAEEPVAKKKK